MHFAQNCRGFPFQNLRASRPQGWLALRFPAHPLHSENTRKSIFLRDTCPHSRGGRRGVCHSPVRPNMLKKPSKQTQRKDLIPMGSTQWKGIILARSSGTHESLLQASTFIETVEVRQGLKICCPEEIAFYNGWISAAQAEVTARGMKNSQYGKYLMTLIQSR